MVYLRHVLERIANPQTGHCRDSRRRARQVCDLLTSDWQARGLSTPALAKSPVRAVVPVKCATGRHATFTDLHRTAEAAAEDRSQAGLPRCPVRELHRPKPKRHVGEFVRFNQRKTIVRRDGCPRRLALVLLRYVTDIHPNHSSRQQRPRADHYASSSAPTAHHVFNA